MTLGRMEKMEMERHGKDQQHINALNEQIAELEKRLAEHGAKIDKVQTGMASFSKDTMRRLGRLSRAGVGRAESS
jgi:multidrug resistance efflux pump